MRTGSTTTSRARWGCEGAAGYFKPGLRPVAGGTPALPGGILPCGRVLRRLPERAGDAKVRQGTSSRTFGPPRAGRPGSQGGILPCGRVLRRLPERAGDAKVRQGTSSRTFGPPRAGRPRSQGASFLRRVTPSARKFAGAPPSCLHRSTNSASSSRIASSIGHKLGHRAGDGHRRHGAGKLEWVTMLGARKAHCAVKHLRKEAYRWWAMSARKSPAPTSTLCVRPMTVPEVPAR